MYMYMYVYATSNDQNQCLRCSNMFFRYLIRLNKWLTAREKLKAWQIFVIIYIFYHVFHIFKSRWFSCKNEERIERENSEGYSTTCQRVAVYRCGEVASKIYYWDGFLILLVSSFLGFDKGWNWEEEVWFHHSFSFENIKRRRWC